jgi:phage baseplate assembly protein W
MSNPALPPPPIGWPLLPQPDDAGSLGYPTLEKSVRDQIRIILLTRPGEQLMRPEFGAGLENYVHEPNNLATRRRIRDLIQENLDAWEPRIQTDLVEVFEVDDSPSEIRVEIRYHIKRTGLPQQINLRVEVQG